VEFSHLVAYGVVYQKTVDASSGVSDAIYKVFLRDMRFSDERRDIIFDRLTDDWGKVEGLLLLKAAPQ